MYVTADEREIPSAGEIQKIKIFCLLFVNTSICQNMFVWNGHSYCTEDLFFIFIQHMQAIYRNRSLLSWQNTHAYAKQLGIFYMHYHLDMTASVMAIGKLVTLHSLDKLVTYHWTSLIFNEVRMGMSNGMSPSFCLQDDCFTIVLPKHPYQ